MDPGTSESRTRGCFSKTRTGSLRVSVTRSTRLGFGTRLSQEDLGFGSEESAKRKKIGGICVNSWNSLGGAILTFRFAKKESGKSG